MPPEADPPLAENSVYKGFFLPLEYSIFTTTMEV